MNKKLTIILISLLALSFVISGCVTGQAKGGNTIRFQCNDGVDNDNDGLIDLNGLYDGKGKNKILVANPDPGCSSEEDNSECDSTQEVCDNIDNDCDGSIDEDLIRNAGQQGICAINTQTCIAGFWQENNEVAPTTEICDNLDNDCNGQIDNGVSCGPVCGDNICELNKTYYCPQDCPVLFSCDDTDNGFNPEIFGVTHGVLNGTGYNNTDYCIDNMTLVENYCSGDFSATTNFDCNLNFTYCNPVIGACVR